MDEFFRFLVESNLTTAAFVIGALAFIIAIIGRIKTIIEPSPAMRFVLALFGLFLMSLSFVSYISFRSSSESPANTVATPELSLPTSTSSSPSQTPQQAIQQPSEVPPQPTEVMLPSATPTPLILAKGKLVYEDNFNSSLGWNVEQGMAIEDGNLIVWPGYDAVPKDSVKYTDFIFESRFYIPESGSMAFYLRHQRPPCTDWNCSIQIALYFDGSYREIAARRFLGDKPRQQIDIRKAKSPYLRPSDWNEVAVRMDGDNYAVYINDNFVLEFVDDTYSAGAFIIDNAADSSGEIRIDYIRIFQLP